MSNKLLFVAFLFFSLGVNGQTVESRAYSVMLSSMLSDAVPMVDVYSIDNLANYQVIDAREKNEFEVSHLLNAQWVGYDDFDENRVKNLDKSKPVLVYCSVGYRSEKVGEKLLSAGFKNVKNLYGGIFEWANAGNPVYKNDTEVKNVHAYDKVWGVWLNINEKVYK